MTSYAAGLQAYRNLIRSAGIAFKGNLSKHSAKKLITNTFCAGDYPVLLAARKEIRNNFEESKTLTPEEQESKVHHAKEVAKVLRMNVVQGKRDESKPDTYDLRIHKDIELGDNDTITKQKSGRAACGRSI